MDERALTQFGHNALGQFKKDWTVAALEERFAAEDRELSLFDDDFGKEEKMDKAKGPAEDVEAMLRSVPPKNILVSIDHDGPAKSLEDYMKERQQKKKPVPKKRKPPRSH